MDRGGRWSRSSQCIQGAYNNISWNTNFFFTWVPKASFRSLPCLQVIEAGANALVAGSAVFGAKDYAEGMIHTFASAPPSDKCLEHFN